MSTYLKTILEARTLSYLAICFSYTEKQRGYPDLRIVGVGVKLEIVITSLMLCNKSLVKIYRKLVTIIFCFTVYCKVVSYVSYTIKRLSVNNVFSLTVTVYHTQVSSIPCGNYCPRRFFMVFLVAPSNCWGNTSDWVTVPHPVLFADYTVIQCCIVCCCHQT